MMRVSGVGRRVYDGVVILRGESDDWRWNMVHYIGGLA